MSKLKTTQIRMKKTLIIGASTKPDRYAFKAANKLADHGHQIELLGRRKGDVAGEMIKNEWQELDLSQLDTVTLYINPKIQPEYYQEIIEAKPKRVIFNPGTENTDFVKLLEKEEIEYENACTLVLLNLNVY